MLPCAVFRTHGFHSSEQIGFGRRGVCLGEAESEKQCKGFLEDVLNTVCFENPTFKITSKHCNVCLTFVQRFKNDSASLSSSLSEY